MKSGFSNEMPEKWPVETDWSSTALEPAFCSHVVVRRKDHYSSSTSQKTSTQFHRYWVLL
jgi:hypothetical protein